MKPVCGQLKLAESYLASAQTYRHDSAKANNAQSAKVTREDE
jgi:hypothetical protein